MSSGSSPGVAAAGSARSSRSTPPPGGTAPRVGGARWAALTEDLAAVGPPWLVARVLVVLAWLVATAVVHHSVPGGSTVQLDQGLFAWDGAFYRDIAEHGYGVLPLEALRFFPLYPLLGRGLAVPGLGIPAALVVLAEVAALGAAVLLRRLVLAEGRDRAEADRAGMFLTLLPASFVLVWAYAEALFLVLAVAAFLAARRDRWALVAACAFGAALTRPTALALAPALALLAWPGLRGGRARDVVGRVAAVAAAPVGLAVYLAWVGRVFGDAWLPFSVQEELRSSANPLARLVEAVGEAVGPERFGDGLHLPFAVVGIALLVVLVRRWPPAYATFAGLVLLAALAADNLNSLERYLLNGFPLVLALATVTGNVRWERAALALCGVGLWALCALAWLGVVVP